MPEPVQRLLPAVADPTAGSIFAAPHSGQPNAARILEEAPEKYRTVVRLREAGMGQNAIAAEVGASIHTVRAILRHAGRLLFAAEPDNARALALLRDGRELALEGVIEALSDDHRRKKMTPDKLALTAAILTDKAQLLSGEATSRVEHVHDGPPASEAFADFLKHGAIDVEANETGIEAVDGGTKGTPALGPAPVDTPTSPAGSPSDRPGDVDAQTPGCDNHKRNDQVDTEENASKIADSAVCDVSGDVSGGRGEQESGGVDERPAETRESVSGRAPVGGEGVQRDAAAATAR